MTRLHLHASCYWTAFQDMFDYIANRVKGEYKVEKVE